MTARIRTRLRYGGILEFIRPAMINMLCAVTEKVDNIREQMDSISIEMEFLERILKNAGDKKYYNRDEKCF